MALIVKETEFVEEMGLYFERQAWPRTAGRMLGKLLVCHPPHQSLEDLAKALQTSKGSISTAGRVLLHYALVEKVKFAQDRRDYFRIADNAWTHHFVEKSRMAANLKILAERGLKVLKGESKKRRERLLKMLQFYKWLERELPLLMRRWEEEQKGSR